MYMRGGDRGSFLVPHERLTTHRKHSINGHSMSKRAGASPSLIKFLKGAPHSTSHLVRALAAPVTPTSPITLPQVVHPNPPRNAQPSVGLMPKPRTITSPRSLAWVVPHTPLPSIARTPRLRPSHRRPSSLVPLTHTHHTPLSKPALPHSSSSQSSPSSKPWCHPAMSPQS